MPWSHPGPTESLRVSLESIFETFQLIPAYLVLDQWVNWCLSRIGSQIMVLRATVSASAGSLLEMQIIRAHSDLLNQKFWGWSPEICILTSPLMTLNDAEGNVWEPVVLKKQVENLFKAITFIKCSLFWENVNKQDP